MPGSEDHDVAETLIAVWVIDQGGNRHGNNKSMWLFGCVPDQELNKPVGRTGAA